MGGFEHLFYQIYLIKLIESLTGIGSGGGYICGSQTRIYSLKPQIAGLSSQNRMVSPPCSSGTPNAPTALYTPSSLASSVNSLKGADNLQREQTEQVPLAGVDFLGF